MLSVFIFIFWSHLYLDQRTWLVNYILFDLFSGHSERRKGKYMRAQLSARHSSECRAYIMFPNSVLLCEDPCTDCRRG